VLEVTLVGAKLSAVAGEEFMGSAREIVNDTVIVNSIARNEFAVKIFLISPVHQHRAQRPTIGSQGNSTARSRMT
jgi:hypothetical protein